MARKPQKKLSQLEQEKASRFYDAIKKIDNGAVRKQAILQSGMDPRTFNKLLKTQEENDKLSLSKIDKRGHYRVNISSEVYAEWDVFREDRGITRETLDYNNTLVMSRYWNTVRSDLSGTNNLESFSPQSIENIYGEKIELERDYTTIERWHRRIVKTQEAKTFNENVYERNTVSA